MDLLHIQLLVCRVFFLQWVLYIFDLQTAQMIQYPWNDAKTYMEKKQTHTIYICKAESLPHPTHVVFKEER